MVSEATGWVAIHFVNISLVSHSNFILLLFQYEVREESLLFPGIISFFKYKIYNIRKYLFDNKNEFGSCESLSKMCYQFL